jgi:hypothetical protein
MSAAPAPPTSGPSAAFVNGRRGAPSQVSRRKSAKTALLAPFVLGIAALGGTAAAAEAGTVWYDGALGIYQSGPSYAEGGNLSNQIAYLSSPDGPTDVNQCWNEYTSHHTFPDWFRQDCQGDSAVDFAVSYPVWPNLLGFEHGSGSISPTIVGGPYSAHDIAWYSTS